MMVLSRHRVNDSRPPAIRAELINGKVICRNARAGGAPRSRGGFFERFVETGETGTDDERDQRRGVQRLTDPQSQDAVVDRPDRVVERTTDTHEPTEQGDGVHDLGRDEDEEQHEHERLAPRTRAPSQGDAGEPAENHSDGRSTDGGGERVAQRQARDRSR